MKRALVLLGSLAFGAMVYAAEKNWLATTQGQLELRNAFTSAGKLGFPRYATADLPTCNSESKGAVSYDTTTNTHKFCNGTAWSTAGTAAFPVSDVTSVVEGSADGTKELRFEVDGFTAGQTRVVTFADSNISVPATVAALAANSFTASQTLAASTALIHGTSARTAAGTKTLVDASVTSVAQVDIAAEAATGGLLIYSIYGTDGATPQMRQGRVIFGAANDGGTETCTLGTPEETDTTPTGTLTVAVACATTPTNGILLTMNADSSLTTTTLEVYWMLDLAGPGAITPQ